MTSVTRRDFVKNSSLAAGLAAAYSIQPPNVLGANEKVNIGTIGVNGMGMSDTNDFIETERTNIVALCDVDSDVLETKADQVENRQDKRPQAYSDFRKLIENKDIDAVVIATPDHWHGIMAIEAMQAGKDIYVEKPCAHNVTECRLIAQAAIKYNRIVQHGTQQRSGKHFQEVKEYVHSGKLGNIAMARTWSILGRESIGKAQPEPAPESIDYKAWLGPAPTRSYTKNHCHYNWRFMWDIGTGDMGNWGVHWLDIALWTLNLEWPQAVSSSGGMYVFDDDKETPDTQITLYDYPNVTVLWELRMWSKHNIENRGVGVAFYGDEQSVVVDRDGWEVFDKEGKKIEEHKPSNDMGLDHKHNFLDSIRDRNPPIADIANGHISAAVAIMGNVAYKANEKVRYNPGKNSLQRGEFNHLLTREYHNGWKLPVV